MKGLSGEPLDNFKLAFHEEAKNTLEGRDNLWALHAPEKSTQQANSSDKRIYYLISIDEIPYLLVGINPTPIQMINLSSFSRIVSEPKGKATVCLTKLIGDKLVPVCRENDKSTIAAMIFTDRGDKVFRQLRQKLPRGIKEIRLFA